MKWAANDFKSAGLDSWIIQYPLAGFTQLMRWYDMLDLGLEKSLLIAIRNAKLIHHVAGRIFDNLLKEGAEGEWRHSFLELIYDRFNAPGIPKDIGQKSLVTANQFWERLDRALNANQWSEVCHHLRVYQNHEDFPIERIQVTVFWALYNQRGHTTPKTFFSNMKMNEPLASAIFDTTSAIPRKAINDILLSIFCPSKRRDPAFILHDTNGTPPFVSHYGPSVLWCGQPGCGAIFYDPDHVDKMTLHVTLRDSRAKHLSEVFRVDESFTSQTGLPEATSAPKAPSSHHNTLHISTARTWHSLDPHDRSTVMHAIMNQIDDVALNKFINDVRHQVSAKSHRGKCVFRYIPCAMQSTHLEALPPRGFLGYYRSHLN